MYQSSKPKSCAYHKYHNQWRIIDMTDHRYDRGSRGSPKVSLFYFIYIYFKIIFIYYYIIYIMESYNKK